MSVGGFSESRLRRMHGIMAGHVERGRVPGIVTLLSRRGEVHVDTIGMKALGANDPMRRDTIFRITSMTKPITAVAAMILIEECKIRLDDPIDNLIPELANRRVLKRIDGPVGDTVPANRPITVRDLLTFRMGLGMIWEPSSSYPIQKAINELQIVGFGAPNQSTPIDADEWLRRVGTLPLMHQPGERWMYNTGSCVLGILIERASGQTPGEFFRERIFEPLGMNDTAFSVPASKLDHLATAYSVNPQTGALDFQDGVNDSSWSRQPVFQDASEGLVSTIDDYLAFGEMLLNRGRRNNVRILSRPSVALMTTDHLTPSQKAIAGFQPGQWDNLGWGFGVSVVTGRDSVAAVSGRFGWDGGYGTSWSSDPAEQMVAILMTQSAIFPRFSPVYLDFWTAAYQAIDD
jgi:CubicO group peptidase (beta-lactamase class C family)